MRPGVRTLQLPSYIYMYTSRCKAIPHPRLNTLRYAARARNIKNTPVVNTAFVRGGSLQPRTLLTLNV